MNELNGAALIDSATRSTAWAGFQFVPVALWTPDGWSNGVPSEPLEVYSSAYLQTGIQLDGDNWLEFYNALWVRARLPVAMGFAPPTCRRAVRGQFLDAALLAFSGDAVTPFVCTDCEMAAELRFGRGCPSDRRRAVSSAFWGLLTSAPAALANYRDRIMYTDGHDNSPTVVGYWQGQFHMYNCRW